MKKHHEGRRNFLKNTSLAAATLAIPDIVSAANPYGIDNKSPDALPWYKRVTRWGQVNITEKDPSQYDIGWWRKFWKRTQTNGVIVNAGGIVAYYPTRIPLHYQPEYLQGRDLFGDLCKAAHEDGIAVFARMDSNRANEEFYKAHPDWFAIDASGKPYRAGDLYITCINGPYYNEHIPSILTEIATLYHPEGFTDNSWSGLGRDSICYCNNCKKSFKDKTGNDIPQAKNWDDRVYREWIKWNYDRRLEIWDLNNRTTKAAGGVDCIWSGMNSGSPGDQSRSFRDLKRICERAEILMLDHQARSDAGGFQDNSETGKLVHGMLGWNKLAPESMAQYQASRPWFRLASKPAAEARMWMLAGIAGGIQPWWHMISAYHEDRRLYKTAEPVLKWHKTNEEYLINREPIATVGLVWSQQNVDFYGRDNAQELIELPWRGMTHALIKARIPYLPVHADDIDRDAKKFSVLILPNVGSMSNEQSASIRRFVENGGGLIATGSSSLYDEWGDMRNDFGLADVFGAHFIKQQSPTDQPQLPKLANDAYHTYLRLTPELRRQMDGPHKADEPMITGHRHEILTGFEETDTLPYGGLLDPLTVDDRAQVLATFIPQFPTYPPEKAWMREPKTDIPGVIVNERANGSRVAFIPADIDRQFGRMNLPDHAQLLINAIKWTAKDNLPLKVDGTGFIDCHLYKQRNSLVLHILNLTNSATWRQPIHELISVGPFKVKIKLPSEVIGRNVKSLVSNQSVKANLAKGWVEFDVKNILDHEVMVVQ